MSDAYPEEKELKLEYCVSASESARIVRAHNTTNAHNVTHTELAGIHPSQHQTSKSPSHSLCSYTQLKPQF